MNQTKLFTQIESELAARFNFPVEVRTDVDREGQPVTYFVVKARVSTVDALRALNKRILEFRIGLEGDIKGLGQRVLMQAEVA